MGRIAGRSRQATPTGMPASGKPSLWAIPSFRGRSIGVLVSSSVWSVASPSVVIEESPSPSRSRRLVVGTPNPSVNGYEQRCDPDSSCASCAPQWVQEPSLPIGGADHPRHGLYPQPAVGQCLCLSRPTDRPRARHPPSQGDTGGVSLPTAQRHDPSFPSRQHPL